MPRFTDRFPVRSPGATPGSGPLLKVTGGSTLAGLLVFLLPGGSPGASTAPYPEGPPPGHAGGFGDPTCRSCHSDHPLNEEGGSLRLRGLPAGYEPGAEYEIRIVLEREGMEKAGFQTTARLASGDAAGTQGGRLAVGDRRVERVLHPETGVAYVHQSRVGSDPSPGGGKARWHFTWTAPEAGAGPVIFHVAANAGNDDASEFGDRIYADSVVVIERTSR